MNHQYSTQKSNYEGLHPFYRTDFGCNIRHEEVQ